MPIPRRWEPVSSLPPLQRTGKRRQGEPDGFALRPPKHGKGAPERKRCRRADLFRRASGDAVDTRFGGVCRIIDGVVGALLPTADQALDLVFCRAPVLAGGLRHIRGHFARLILVFTGLVAKEAAGRFALL